MCDRTQEQFDEITAEIGKAIANALKAYATRKGITYEGPAPESDDDVALAIDAAPTVRALVTIAGEIVKNCPTRIKVDLIEASLKHLAFAGGNAFLNHMRGEIAARMGDDDEHGPVAGFTRPLGKTIH